MTVTKRSRWDFRQSFAVTIQPLTITSLSILQFHQNHVTARYTVVPWPTGSQMLNPVPGDC